MYPVTCAGGFNAPAKAGKWELVGFTAMVDDPTAASELTLIDDPAIKSNMKAGFIYPTSEVAAGTSKKHIIAGQEGHGSAYDTVLEWWPAEPVKLRYGLSLAFTNIKQGSMCVYTK